MSGRRRSWYCWRLDGLCIDNFCWKIVPTVDYSLAEEILQLYPISICLSSISSHVLWLHCVYYSKHVSRYYMRPFSLGGGRILRRTLSVCLSVRLSVRPVIVSERHVAPPSELQWHTCTFPHALRAAYRTAISDAQTCLLKGKGKSKGSGFI